MWITAPGGARVRIGAGTFLNLGVMVAAQELVEIGEHCMLANGCFVSDATTATTIRSKPITWQGFESKGPTRIGDNCWLGANVVVTSGVTIGERCVIGANSVVTRRRRAVLDRRRGARAGDPAHRVRVGNRARGVAAPAPSVTLSYEAMRCAPTTRRFTTEPVPREALRARARRTRASRPAAATARAGG